MVAGALTEKQQETMLAIVECIYWDGRPPTIRELGARFMILPNAVLDRVVALRKKGWLERQDGTRSLIPTGMSLDEPVVERVLRVMKHFEQQRLASKECKQQPLPQTMLPFDARHGRSREVVRS